MEPIQCQFKSPEHLQKVLAWMKSHGVTTKWDFTDGGYIKNTYLFLTTYRALHTSGRSRNYSELDVTAFCQRVFEAYGIKSPILQKGDKVFINGKQYKVLDRYLDYSRVEDCDFCFETQQFNELKKNKYQYVSDIIGYEPTCGWFPEVNECDSVALTMIYEDLVRIHGKQEIQVENKLPESWCVKIDGDSEIYEPVFKWIHVKHKVLFCGDAYGAYYGICRANKPHYSYDNSNFAVELSLQAFIELAYPYKVHNNNLINNKSNLTQIQNDTDQTGKTGTAIEVRRPDLKIRNGEIIRGKEISGRPGKASVRVGYPCHEAKGVRMD